MGLGLRITITSVHWLRETGVACGRRGEPLTFALGEVSCPECRAAIETEIDALALPQALLPPPAQPGAPFDLTDVW